MNDNKVIIDKLDTIQETLKVLLVNDVLHDAETLTGKVQTSKKELELQQKVQELTAELQGCQEKIQSLQSQNDTQKKRMETLQQLSESKDRTLKTREEEIQIIRKQLYTAEQLRQQAEDSLKKNQAELQNYRIEAEKHRREEEEHTKYAKNVGMKCKVSIGTEAYDIYKKDYVAIDTNACAKSFNIQYYDPIRKMYRITRSARSQDYAFWIAVDNVRITNY